MYKPCPFLALQFVLIFVLAVGCYDSRSPREQGSDGAANPAGDEGVVDDDETADETATDGFEDLDGDGWSEPEDCDDQDAEVHPAANEVCNDLDDDCDNLVDEDAGAEWFEDHDGDGYGIDESFQITCDPDPHQVLLGGDCDDDDASIYPGNPALVDGVDSDCDGALDWRVTIYVAVDDAGELCIDSWENLLGDTGVWVHGTVYEHWLDSGVHVLGIKGWDLGHIVTAAVVHAEISTGQSWVSDESWRYDPNPTANEQTRVGWCAPFFDDSGWDLVLDIGPIGIAPWAAAPSSFPANSPAHWIWDHFPVQLNTQYLRKEIVLP